MQSEGDGAGGFRGAPFPPGLRLTIQMVLATRRWRSLLDERLRPIGHSAARMEAMSTIAHAASPSTQVEIARRIGIEGATLTRMLDSLEADGLVERLADPADRRTKRIRLTGEGEAALAQIFTITNALRDQLLAPFPAGHVDEANLFLRRLLDRLDEPFASP